MSGRLDVTVLPVPVVEVLDVEVEGRQEGSAPGEGLVVREAVVRHMLDGLRGELFRELIEMMEV
jgi:hypothetical protein